MTARVCVNCVVVTWLLSVHGLHAQASAPELDASSTEEPGSQAYGLFLEGRALLEQGQPQPACERLEQSLALAPTLGTLLNLGLCNRRASRLASARAYYQRAQQQAEANGDAERQQLALGELMALQSQVATLTFRVAPGVDPGLELFLDGAAQASESLDFPVFVDAGEHRLLARAPGRLAWRERVVVRDREHHVLTIPSLQHSPEARAPSTPPAPERLRPQVAARSEPGAAQRVTAFAFGGAAVLALAGTVIFAVLASADAESALPYCTEHDVCYPRGVALRQAAKAQATRADVAGLIGAAALTVGVTLWLTLPAERTTTPTRLGLNAASGALQLRLSRRF